MGSESNETQPADAGGSNTQEPESAGESASRAVLIGKIVDNLPGEFAGLAQTSHSAMSQMILQRIGASFILQQENLIRGLEDERKDLRAKLEISQLENKNLAIELATTKTSLKADRATRSWRAVTVLAGGILIPIGAQLWSETTVSRGISAVLVLLGIGVVVAGLLLSPGGKENA